MQALPVFLLLGVAGRARKTSSSSAGEEESGWQGKKLQPENADMAGGCRLSCLDGIMTGQTIYTLNEFSEPNGRVKKTQLISAPPHPYPPWQITNIHIKYIKIFIFSLSI